MTDIIVYTSPEVLEHKISLAEAYWDLHNEPKESLKNLKVIFILQQKDS